jgi:superfamily II RNA helicase
MHKTSIKKLRDALAEEVKQAEGMILAPELKQRQRVLRRLGYLDQSGVVTRKGHVRVSVFN